MIFYFLLDPNEFDFKFFIFYFLYFSAMLSSRKHKLFFFFLLNSALIIVSKSLSELKGIVEILDSN